MPKNRVTQCSHCGSRIVEYRGKTWTVILQAETCFILERNGETSVAHKDEVKTVEQSASHGLR